MTAAIVRKARRLIGDPVLRRWVLSRALGRVPPSPAFTPHRPPYLSDIDVEGAAEGLPSEIVASFRSFEAGTPQQPLTLNLPGQTVVLSPGEESLLFEQNFADTETQLAAYRFAWLPMSAEATDHAWVSVLWNAFARRFAEPDKGWAWHPYTAAERSINILDYARWHGLPGQRDATLAYLGQHASLIASRLEYFGDHNTSNHLANNGRGLYRIGLALGLSRTTEIGKRILLNEAERIFLSSGVLREGSTHYHLLLLRNYADAFLAAHARGRPEAGLLGGVVARGLAALDRLVLPGGLPLIGDISPDCPPEFLAGLIPGNTLDTGWGKLLTADERTSLKRLAPSAIAEGQLAADGWIRTSCGDWASLWHVAPEGWAAMPGHAHQDMGSFEVHWRAMPLFVDPGRGSYDETGEGGFYTSAAAHNGLTVDGHDPYPPNKPYYNPAFRRTVAGPLPRVVQRRDGISVVFGGFRRLSGLGEVGRDVDFDANVLTILDEVAGRGRHHLVRRLHTIWPVECDGHRAVVHTACGDFCIEADQPLSVSDRKRWVAYGVCTRAWVIEAAARIDLPARLTLRVWPSLPSGAAHGVSRQQIVGAT